MRFRKHIGLATVAAVLLTGCGGAEETDGSPEGPAGVSTGAGASNSPRTSNNAVPVDKAGAERVARRFVDAANAGDEKGVEATFTENARFDSVGRIYLSRADIMNRFLIPEVLDVGGHYKATGSRWDGDRYVVNYDFKTSGGGGESFSYAFLIHDGLIRDVAGRY
ncbi:nuclear transport factor 2 family protein [Actinomadura rubrisoli]|uniref:Nuclear transport factor 2 family protein n=1 Tax=Actinomadura rubrisoli TaxID=2530368 RepID=A0A4R5B8A7_9ACTN|nr:nuclear transport factor 2 family protein [Actinomadura rubrisoli]TDD82201.1 nuclear transport factor 2 family protein [Actinomadura rubrisoli]